MFFFALLLKIGALAIGLICSLIIFIYLPKRLRSSGSARVSRKQFEKCQPDKAILGGFREYVSYGG
ncbi:MAG: hypothetical protein ACTSYY_07430 [Promethearchaeota archaeon]